MKKKTIVIVSLTLVLALLAIAVIATFPTYLFEDTAPQDSSSVIQSGNIVENEGGQGDDVGVLADDDEDANNGAEGVLPTPDDEELGYSETPVAKLEPLAEAKNVKVLAEFGAFQEGTKVKVKKLGAFDKAFYRTRHYLRGVAEKFTAYNFTATNDGKSVSPNATVKLSFDIPENYNSKNLFVYYLLEKGLQELDCDISVDGKTATVKATQTGVYVFAEKSVKNTDGDTSSDNTSTESDKADSSSTTTSSEASDPSSTTSSTTSDTSSDQGSSNTSSEVSSDTPSDSTSSDSSSDTSSDSTSSDDDTSSDSTSSVDPNKESMNGWTPWQ